MVCIFITSTPHCLSCRSFHQLFLFCNLVLDVFTHKHIDKNFDAPKEIKKNALVRIILKV